MYSVQLTNMSGYIECITVCYLKTNFPVKHTVFCISCLTTTQQNAKDINHCSIISMISFNIGWVFLDKSINLMCMRWDW